MTMRPRIIAAQRYGRSWVGWELAVVLTGSRQPHAEGNRVNKPWREERSR